MDLKSEVSSPERRSAIYLMYHGNRGICFHLAIPIAVLERWSEFGAGRLGQQVKDVACQAIDELPLEIFTPVCKPHKMIASAMRPSQIIYVSNMRESECLLHNLEQLTLNFATPGARDNLMH